MNLLSVSPLLSPLPACCRLTFSLKLKSTQLKVRHWRLTLQAPLLAFLSGVLPLRCCCWLLDNVVCPPLCGGALSVWTAVKSDFQGPKLHFHFQKSEFCTTKSICFIDCLLLLLFLFNSYYFFCFVWNTPLSIENLRFFCLNAGISSLTRKTFKSPWQHPISNSWGLLNLLSFEF